MKRKRQQPGPDPGSDSSESEGSSDFSCSDSADEQPSETIQVDLEFFDPKDIDFLGLKALLQTFLDGETYACSELVDTIIKQPTVGSVVKTDGSVDPVAVLTVFNTQRYAGLACMADIRQFLLRHCKDVKLKTALQRAWDSQRTGFILSERLVNCPPALSPPLQQALFDEIEWAQEDEPTQELKDFFKFDQFIIGAATPLIIYARPEDEFYHQHCSWSYTFAVANKAVGKGELHPHRLVMLLTPQQIAAARKQLDQVVGNAASTRQ